MKLESYHKKLGLTRSSINAWEMGLSVPSTQYIAAMTTLFNVSADYILCLSDAKSISISGLTDEDVAVVHALVNHLRSKNADHSN